MKTNEVKLDKTKVDYQSELKNVHKGYIVTSDNVNFVDFLNDQLNFNIYSKTIDSQNIDKEDDKVDKKDKVKIENSEKETNPANVNNNPEIYSSSNDVNKDKEFVDQYLKIDAKKLSLEELKNIQQIINNNGFSININQIMGFNNYSVNYNGTKYSSGSMCFAKNLSDMLNESYKTNKPIRIDFDNNSVVVLKIDKEGKLSAQFLSSDKAMEMLLKENLYLLRAKLDKEGLPYKELLYKNNSDNNQERSSKKEG